MYPYHNKIKQRIKNDELVGFEFAEDWPKIGSCMLLRFSTAPALRPIRPKRYAEYAPILKAWAQKQLGTQTDVEESGRALSELEAGEVFKVGDYEFVVLEHSCGTTGAIMKNPALEMKFGSNNNFNGSDVDGVCKDFAEKLAEIVGDENILEHNVVLTSDDGLDDYGEIPRRVSLLTTEQYRRYVKILDQHKPDSWWWLATPHSTSSHGNDRWVKCVSPSGFIISGGYINDFSGVRPFCIFKSSIFVS